jgi:uncharacterized GH25 family protein
MNKILSVCSLLAALLVANTAFAHSLWVNLSESFAHPPGHALAVLGWGHNMPLDDLLVSDTGTISLQSYSLIGPDNKSTDLGLPVLEQVKPVPGAGNTMTFQGDLGIRKVALTENTAPGTYQVNAVSKSLFFTQYQDAKGNTKVAMKPMDEIEDIKEVLMAVKYQSFAKSFFAIKEWTEPAPQEYELEVMPLTDLSKVHAGDMVSFQVTYMGKPVNVSAEAMHNMTFTSNAFGGPDGFVLSSYVMNGVAQFRAPAAGQWVANIYYKQDVDKDPSLKALKGKCNNVYTAASVCFTVKP